MGLDSVVRKALRDCIIGATSIYLLAPFTYEKITQEVISGDYQMYVDKLKDPFWIFACVAIGGTIFYRRYRTRNHD